MSASDLPRVRPAARLDRVADARAGAASPPDAERGEAAASQQRRAVLVVGMHRSGTSAFTRVLSLQGASLPRHLMAASERNPLGYFESQPIYELHQELLAEAGSAWDDLAPFPPEWFESPAAPVWIDRMAEAFRAEFGDEPVVALKDPRMARLIPLWLRVLDRVGYEPAFVIPVRNPLDVAASLARAERVPRAKALLLWLEHLLAAERDTRERRRCFASYDDLLEDWRRVMARISTDLDLRFPRASLRAAAEIDAFLAGELRHHATAPDEVMERLYVPSWVQRAYEWALRAAAGQGADPAALDAIEGAMRPAGRAFGPVVAALEVARSEAAASAARFEAKSKHYAAEVERLTAERDRALRDGEAARESLAEREAQIAQMVDWLKLLLGWAMRAVHGGEGTDDHLVAVMQAAEAADASVIPQVAALGMRLSQQAAELVRVSEEADVQAAEARRLARDLDALRAELSVRDAERAELATLRDEAAALRAQLEERQAELARQAKEAERANQQVRGLWQQLAARDAERARLRQEVAELEVLRHQAAEVGPLRREAGALRAQVAELEKLRAVVGELEGAAAEVAALRAASASRESALAKVGEELREASAAIAERDLFIEALRARVGEVERSRLWRALRPVARLAEDFGAIFRG